MRVHALRELRSGARASLPPEVLRLFETLGVSCCREAKVFHNCRLQNGLHSYGAWFHFVGAIEDGKDAAVVDALGSTQFDLEKSNSLRNRVVPAGRAPTQPLVGQPKGAFRTPVVLFAARNGYEFVSAVTDDHRVVAFLDNATKLGEKLGLLRAKRPDREKPSYPPRRRFSGGRPDVANSQAQR